MSTLNGTIIPETLIGGSGDDVISYDDPAKINGQNDAIDGGSGTDTLALLGSDNYFDLSQASITNVEVLELGYGDSVLLSAAQLSGMTTITGNYYSTLRINGSVDLTNILVNNLVSIAAGSAGNDTLIGSADDNTFAFSTNANIGQSGDNIDGGSGSDTLALTGQEQSYDITSATLANIETLQIGYGSTVVLSAGQLAGFDTINGNWYTILNINGNADFSGIAVNSLVSIAAGSTGNDTLIGSADDNTFTFATPANIGQSGDSIDGGIGTDALALTGQQQSYNITQATFTSIETLRLGWGSSVTLSSEQLAGINTINGDWFTTLNINGNADFSGIAVNSLVSIAAGSTGNDTLIGSADDNTFVFATPVNIGQSGDSINGGIGIGTDTLALTGQSQSYDISQASLTSIEALRLGWGSTVTLSSGQLAGINTINGDWFTTLNINGNADFSGIAVNNLVSIAAGSTGNDTLIGSADDNTFAFATPVNIGQAGDSINGGIGTDTLALTGQSQSYNISQASLTSIEALRLGWGSTATLSSGQLAGITTINGDWFTTLNINGSANFNGIAVNNLVSIAAGSIGNDTLIGSADDNTFVFATPANVGQAGDSINGGGGTDTLALTGQSQSYNISQARLTSIETLKLGWGSDVTLSSGQLAGITTINGDWFTTLNINGSANFNGIAVNNLVSIAAGSIGNDTLIGSADDNTFAFATPVNIGQAGDSINGGIGTDTLALTGQQQSYDITQAHLASIETLGLGWGSSVTLSAGQLPGITTINGDWFTTLNINGSVNFNGIAVNNLVSIAAGSTGNDTVTGSADDNTFVFASPANIGQAGDSIDGGIGTDTLALSGQQQSYDITQSTLTRIETLKLGWGSTVTLSSGQLAGIHTINGDWFTTLHLDGNVDLSGIAINSLVNIAAGSTGIDHLIGSADDNTFVFSNNANIGQSGDVIDGGAGSDTLYLAGATTTYDLSNVDLNNIETVKLAYNSTVTLRPDQVSAITAIDGDYYSQVEITGPVDISHLNVTGFVNIAVGTTGIDTIVGSASDDTFLINDAANINGQADQLNGGEGSDTLYLKGSGDTFDISQAVLTNLDNLQVAYGDKVTLSADQIVQFDTIDGVSYHTIHVTGSNPSTVQLGGVFGIEGLTAPVPPGHGEVPTGEVVTPPATAHALTSNLTGSTENDLYIINGANNIAEGTNGGVDTVQSTVAFTLPDNLENITLVGDAAINGSGNTLGNVLLGNDGANTLQGFAGRDTLFGGGGNDQLVGGAGDDQYWVDSNTDTLVELSHEGTDSVFSSADWLLGSNLEDLTLMGQDNINATGNSLNNELTGNSGSNRLDGGTGIDTMAGGTGNDTYLVDNAGDITTETSTLPLEIDTVRASISRALGGNLENLVLTGTAAINGTGNELNNILTGNTGNNVLNGSAGIDTMVGGTGNDTYIVDNSDDVTTETSTSTSEIDTINTTVTRALGANFENLVLTGTEDISGTGNVLNNALTGNSGNNLLDGGVGADILNGGIGIDTMIGGAGNDTYFVDNAGDIITETNASASEIDTVNAMVTRTLGANLENLTLTGTETINGTGNALNNTLTGNSSNNVLDGGVGADTLNGGIGVDTMIGGVGNDTYFVDNANDITTETSTSASEIDTVNASVTRILGANLENLVLMGMGALNGTGNALNNLLTGNSGNNALDGGVGADTLNGGVGVDTMSGGAGNDTYFVDNANDITTETSSSGSEIDTINATVTRTLGANFENLVLTGTGHINGTGNALNNHLTGNSGNNILNGGVGADIMTGGTGNDTYFVDNTNDVIIETGTSASEIDTVNASVTYTLGANLENLTLTGTGAINGTGNALNNFLIGNAGNNTLNGSGGNDTLTGGTGNDILTGGSGNDIFRFDTALTNNRDTITDYNVVNDTIQLENAVFTSLVTTGVLAAGSFRFGAGITTAADANDFLIYNSTSGALYYDADGNGAGHAVQFATLSTGLGLTNADFLII
ncbi:serralysin [Gammaproteobacteria bacterium]